MIQNKDKELIKTLKGIMSGKTDVLELISKSQNDRERILTIFIITIGCEKVLGLEPKVLFDKLLKYKDVVDINNIVKKEYDKRIKEQANSITTSIKEFIENFSGDMIKSMTDELDQRNRDFVSINYDKFVLVKPAIENISNIQYYTTEEGDTCFDNEIMFAKTFETFDEANKYRNENNLNETKIYSVEDCKNLIN